MSYVLCRRRRTRAGRKQAARPSEAEHCLTTVAGVTLACSKGRAPALALSYSIAANRRRIQGRHFFAVIEKVRE